MTALSDLVSVRTRYRRAVNLAADSQDVRALDDILVTPLVAHTLERLLDNLENAHGEHSFMLFGPYGAGKSTFALFVNALFCKGAQKGSQAYRTLCQNYPNLAQRFSAICREERPWLCVSITARRSPIGQLVLEGLLSALASLPETSERQALQLLVQEHLHNAAWTDSNTVLDSVEKLQHLAQLSNYGGLLLIVDEVGKSLEYALQDKAGGDVYLFQVLAEYTKRTLGIPMLFLTVQHQNFDGYTELGNTTLRHEWAKVQERFEPLPFNEQLASGLNTLGQVLQYHAPLPNALLSIIDQEAQIMLDAQAKLPAGMQNAEFIQICRKTWPLHPSVVLILPLLFQRLAQNERSLFSYLASQEPYGFQEHCRRGMDEDYGFVRLYDIADYLLTNMAATLVQRPAARILVEALHNDTGLSSFQVQILRTVGILNVLGNSSPLKATESILKAILPAGEDLMETLHGLRRKELLTFRQIDKSFRLWEGGSIDIEELLTKARKQLRFEGTAFMDLLKEHVSMRPLVARKHTLQSGAYRFFELEYSATIPDYTSSPKGQGSCEAGHVLVLLPMNDLALLGQQAQQATTADPSLVVAIPKQLDMLRGPAIELACLRWVEKHTPELRGDRRALREYNLLLADCERRIRQNADLLLDPRPAPWGNSCRWFWNGEQQALQRPVDVTRLLSRVCDALYPYAPQIRNELIARPVLSAAATAARTALLKRMLTYAHIEHLGIDGFPPERSMYESVLHETGLHRRTESGQWQLCEPDERSPLFAIWRAIDQEIYANAGECVSLPQIFEKLVHAPYGVPEGLLPVLVLAFYLCRTTELFIYREGSFLLSLDDANIELLQRRPDLFAISGIRLAGGCRILLEKYAAGLHIEATVPAVVFKIIGAVRQLPPITHHTSQLAAQRGKALRDCCREARSPEKLLFDILPKAFGLPSFLEVSSNDPSSLLPIISDSLVDDFAAAMRESMIELVGFAPKIRSQCRDELLFACGLPSGPLGWTTFLERARFLAQRVHNHVISPLLERASRVESNEDVRLEGILGIVLGRSFDRWGDRSITEFKNAAQGMGEQFRRSWEDYGSSFLTKDEQQAKERVQKRMSALLIEEQIPVSSRVLIEVLRDLIREAEHKEMESHGKQ